MQTVSPVLAETPPVDNDVKAALYDISRAEQQMTGLSARQAAKIKRIRRGLESARARLKASSNKADDSWKEADRRLSELVAKLDAMTSSTQSRDESATPETGQTPTAKAETPASAADALSKHERELLGSVNRQTEGLYKELQNVSVVDLQQASVAERWQKRVQYLKELYLQLSQPKHPDALDVARKITVVETYLVQAITTANAEAAQLGDVKAEVAEIEKRVYQTRVPHAPTLPAPKAEIMTYAETVMGLLKQAEEDISYLESIAGKTSLVAPSTIDSLSHALRGRIERDVPRAIKLVVDRLDGALDQPRWRIKQVAESDPDNPSHQANRLLDASERDATLRAFNDAIETVALLADFERATGLDPKDRSKIAAEYRAAIDAFNSKYEIALDVVRFPKVRSTNDDMRDVAKTVLSNPSYKVNAILRLEITSERRRHNRRESDVDVGAVNTTVTTTNYVWEEFTVTTAEEVGGQVYLFHNVMKFFHSGGSDVPVGAWTLGDRRKSKRILKKNVHL